MLARARLAPIVLAALSVGLACDAKSSASNDDDGGSSSGSGAGSDSADSSSAPSCADETRDDDYMLGLERSGSHVTVRFIDAMPAPPARFDNTWILEVDDLQSGAPMAEIDLEVEPYMPDHMHGTSIATKVTAMTTPGQIELAPVNLFMPGLWEVRLHFTLDEGATDEVVFRFCVDP